MVASVGVVAVLVAVLVAAGLDRAGSSGALGRRAQASVTQPHRPAAARIRDCDFTFAAGQPVLPRLVRSRAAPDSSLRSVIARPRDRVQPATQPNLGGLDRRPTQVLSIYARYVRIVSAGNGVRIALIPARVCAPIRPVGAAAPEDTVPRDYVLAHVLSGPAGRHATLELGTPAQIRSGQAAALGRNVVTAGHRVLAVLAVPDGVVRVVCRLRGRAPRTVTAVVHDHIAVAEHLTAASRAHCGWYSAGGQLIRTVVTE